MKPKYAGLIFMCAIIVSSCSTFSRHEYQIYSNVKLVDGEATKETVNLFYNLKKIQKKSVIIGQHHATAYGIGWQHDKDRSDIKDIAGTHPGVYGWDITDITNSEPEKIEFYTSLIKEAYARGGINVFCWHYNNPVTGGLFYDTTVAVKHILPSGSRHEIYKTELNKIADFANSLTGPDNEPIPLIFRPFHEFDGNWFWWGKPFCSREEFIELWHFTVKYLRDEKNVRNFIYAFSPDRFFQTEAEFLERYPGDDFVDLLGMDNYGDFQNYGQGIEGIRKKLTIISNYAQKTNKVAALTETGVESIPDSLWWTAKFLPAIKKDSIKIAFAMLWRNDNPKHHYAPYPGHKSVPDFLKLKEDPYIIFQDKLKNPYIIDSQLLTSDYFSEK